LSSWPDWGYNILFRVPGSLASTSRRRRTTLRSAQIVGHCIEQLVRVPLARIVKNINRASGWKGKATTAAPPATVADVVLTCEKESPINERPDRRACRPQRGTGVLSPDRRLNQLIFRVCVGTCSQSGQTAADPHLGVDAARTLASRISSQGLLLALVMRDALEVTTPELEPSSSECP
jgi:hypothetical protein